MLDTGKIDYATLMAQLQRIEENTRLAAKRVLTISDVAMLTGLSVSYRYKMTSAKQLPFYRPNGKCIFFNREEIEDWMLQNRANTIDEAEQQASKYLLQKGGKL